MWGLHFVVPCFWKSWQIRGLKSEGFEVLKLGKVARHSKVASFMIPFLDGIWSTGELFLAAMLSQSDLTN